MKYPYLLFLVILMFVASCRTASAVPPPQDPTGTPLPVSTNTLIPSPTFLAVPADTTQFQPFGNISITAEELEFSVSGDGADVDSISFWEAPDPTQSLMFVTSKGNSSIEVYQYPFSEQLKTISCGNASNGVWVDQERDLLYITRRHSSDICAYNLPDLDVNSALSFTTAATGGDSEPNLTILKLPGGQRRIYVSYDNQVYYHDGDTGKSLGTFAPSKGLETMYGDDYYQVLYIPDEGDRTGVYVYDPDGNPAGPTFGDRSIFDSDAEGIWVFKCPSIDVGDSGEGLILVADQKEDSTDFEVFHRRTKAHLGKLNISGVNNTDGIAITQQSFPDYPLGLLAVIDDDQSTVGVGWDTILAKTGLSCSN